MFARQILNEQSDLVRKMGRMQKKSERLLLTKLTLDGRDLWDALCRLCPLQSFPATITSYLSNSFKDSWLYEMWRALQLWQSLETWWEPFFITDLNSLLSTECGRAGVTIKKSRLWLQHACLGIFSARVFGQDIVVGSYCGPPILADLCSWQNAPLIYSRRLKKVTREIL